MKNIILGAGRFRTAVIIFILATSVNSCKKDSPATPGANQVFMENIAFTPASITVAVNSTVTWTNKDNVAHNVTSTWFASSTINPGGTYSHQFTTTGTFPYECTIHTGMTGTVVVQ